MNPYPDRGGSSLHHGLPGYRAWWGLPALPKLNVTDPGMREYLMGVAEHWLRFGIDGWRLDVPAEIEDPTIGRCKVCGSRTAPWATLCDRCFMARGYRTGRR